MYEHETRQSQHSNTYQNMAMHAQGATQVRAKHFDAALSGLQPAMTAEELEQFASWQPA